MPTMNPQYIQSLTVSPSIHPSSQKIPQKKPTIKLQPRAMARANKASLRRIMPIIIKTITAATSIKRAAVLDYSNLSISNYNQIFTVCLVPL